MSALESSGSYIELIAYIGLLQAHDWPFEYSDDPRVWRAGVEQQDRLRGMQKRIDPDGLVWDWNCPPDYRLNLSKDSPDVRQENP